MDWQGWEQEVLAKGGWQATSENVLFLQEWGAHEQSKCFANPLSTTQKYGNSTNCVQTSPGGPWVQAYQSTVDGAKATVQTLNLPYYPNIRAALASGDPFTWPGTEAVAQDLRTWGSDTFATFYLQQASGIATAAGGGGNVQFNLPIGARTGHALSGYASLRHQLAHTFPTALFQSRHTGQATLRLLARRSKVAG